MSVFTEKDTDTDNNRTADINARIAKGFTLYKTDRYLSSIAMGNYTTDSTANSYGYCPITIDSTGFAKMQAYRDGCTWCRILDKSYIRISRSISAAWCGDASVWQS